MLKQSTLILFVSLLLLSPITAQASFKDYFQAQIDEIRELIFFEERKNSEEMKKYIGEYTDNGFVCTGGVDPSTISKKLYLEKFAAGPCAPLVALPGLTGSKLIARIDCEKLKSSNPDLFSDCGWNSCKSGFLKSAPRSEYRVWMPDPFGPFSLNLFAKNRRCFAGFMALRYELIDGQYAPEEPNGITMYTLGESPESLSNSECGWDAISNTYPAEDQPEERYHYFGNINQALKAAGYIPGLTSQAMPYDWRLSYAVHSLDVKFPITIEKMREMVGKKVVIVAHSMGNYQTLHNLYKMSQEWKDSNVARYIALAPPFMGSPQSSQTPLGLDSTLNQQKGLVRVGIDAKEYKYSMALYPTIWQLMIKPGFKTFANTSWMSAIKQRIKEEAENLPITKGTIMDIFPDYNKECNPGFESRPSGCFTGIKEIYDIGSVNNEPMNPDNFEDILRKYSFLGEDGVKLYQYSKDPRFANLDNPGVQTSIVYATQIDTIYKIIYNSSPKPIVENDEYYAPDTTINESGDGVVLTGSAIVPGIKWASEFDSKVAGAKPVNLVELCSDYNQRTSVFENQDSKTVLNNAYFGIACHCRGTKDKPTDGVVCNHGGMVVDAGLVDFVVNSAIDNQVGKVGDEFAKMSDAQLQSYISSCKLFNP